MNSKDEKNPAPVDDISDEAFEKALLQPSAKPSACVFDPAEYVREKTANRTGDVIEEAGNPWSQATPPAPEDVEWKDKQGLIIGRYETAFTTLLNTEPKKASIADIGRFKEETCWLISKKKHVDKGWLLRYKGQKDPIAELAILHQNEKEQNRAACGIFGYAVVPSPLNKLLFDSQPVSQQWRALMMVSGLQELQEGLKKQGGTETTREYLIRKIQGTMARYDAAPLIAKDRGLLKKTRKKCLKLDIRQLKNIMLGKDPVGRKKLAGLFQEAMGGGECESETEKNFRKYFMDMEILFSRHTDNLLAGNRKDLDKTFNAVNALLFDYLCHVGDPLLPLPF
jgi:hypothetical protein